MNNEGEKYIVNLVVPKENVMNQLMAMITYLCVHYKATAF